ncbi:MAG: DUF1799 domain-containing protein [Emcibacter sp.]|nr:DUF1799 domain-containing protein [Emcibacter sp.]
MHHGSEGKKLIEAAAYDISGTKDAVSDKFIADLEKTGAPPEIIKEYQDRAARNVDFIVHFDNWDIIRLFTSCRTQWRRGGLNGIKIGLDYVAVQVVATARNIELSEDNFMGLQVMEAESLRILNERD